MKHFFVALCALAFSACAAFSIPTTPDELKHAADNTSFANSVEFAIPGTSLAAVRSRLAEYSERCLSMEKIYEKCAIGCTRTKPQVYTPKIRSLGASRVQLTLQRTDPNSIKVKDLPKDGMYVMVAEASSKGGVVTGHVWAAKYGYGDITGSTKGWMTGDDKTCPNL
jgi:hypothetical protein